MTIAIIVLLAFVLYRLADGRVLHSMVASAAIVLLFALLDTALRGLPVQAYLFAFTIMWLGLQMILPAIEKKQVIRFEFGRIPTVRLGRLAIAVLPQGV